MDPLQLQLLLKQMRNKATMGPESEYVYVPDGLGTSVPMPPKHKMPTIGPVPGRTGLTDGLSVLNELGLDMNAPQGPNVVPSPASKGTKAMPFFNDADPNNPDLPAAPDMFTSPESLPSIPAEYAADMQSQMPQGPQPTGVHEGASPSASPSAAPVANGRELPYQTYERLTGQKWTGGRSKSVQDILSRLGITAVPGSPEANLALQKALTQNAEGIEG